MISVKWREHGSVNFKVFVAKRLTYIGGQGEFALWANDGTMEIFAAPAHLEATPTINAPRKGKED